MTIPAGAIWCPTCLEACHDHSRICTVCGSTLVHPPNDILEQQQPQHQEPSIHAVVPDHLMQQLRESTTAMRDLVRQLHVQVQQVQHEQQHVLEGLQHLQQQVEQEQQHDALFDVTLRKRPTARATLAALPRIVLQTNSYSLFRQASLSFVKAATTTTNGSSSSSTTTTARTTNVLETMQAIPGEFGSSEASISLDQAVMVVAEPRTGTGNTLSTETLQTIQALMQQTTTTTTLAAATAADNDNNNHETTTAVDVILYMERGGGVTFVQKAALAQQAGAKALVIGNNQAEPWPFVMRDSNNEAVAYHLTIPVVVVKQADGQAILSKYRSSQGQSQQTAVACALSIQPQSKECVICTETLQIGQTVLQIPACGHVFHESCALQWLEHHNTCPYCRRELPTDDPEYEQERRRAQRTHAGSEGRSSTQQQQQSSASWNDFYG